MKKLTLIATALVAGFGASQAEAQLLGSDTLKDVTTDIIAACAGVSPLTYSGTGSGNGENAMNAATPTQSVAPMSRKVKCTISAAKPTAEGKRLGYDAISIVGSSCTPLTASNCVNKTGLPGYTFQAGTDNGAYPLACDALRVLYFGRDHNNTTDCNSATRHALVDTWGPLFEGTPSSTTCTELRHAFRRDDASGTTDTLRTACGIPSATNFCNGTSGQDNDPIRRPVPPTKGDIAKADGTLGVVLPISIPSSADAYSPGTPAANSCGAATAGTTRCSSGKFKFSAFPGISKCPGNVPRTGGLCRVPLTAAGDANCVNSSTNCPSGTAPGTDCRVFNNQPRHADGTFVQVVSPYYRLHETRAYFGNGCKENDDTSHIGCLTAADSCSVGFAGREVDTIASTAVIQLSNASSVCVPPDNASILSGAYPISRKLYFSSLVGFANVTNANEAALSVCMSNPAKVSAAIQAHGFVVDPLQTGATPSVATESFAAPNCF